MKLRLQILSAAFLLIPALLWAAGGSYQPAAVIPPPVAREFRGAWIATVANLDWPSKPGLPVAQQKTELIALLDRAAQLKLNAVIFQVRPMCDAMYASPLEPWSAYLTGVQGRAPQPFYDPLAFAIKEAHQRGLELHAWLNPFRVSSPQARLPMALDNITRTHPELVRHYGDLLWLDPGQPAAREHVLRVILDVVKRYDVDGVQFDDYFYPYPQSDAAGRSLDFPDAASWRQFGAGRGLTRDGWRRQNINRFIQDVYQNIKAAKPWVKFGVSPFGIWRPGNPPPIKGFDAFARLYADSRRWLADGWLDYLSPQLYWPVNSPGQSFPVLLRWWAQENVKARNLWPGLAASAVGAKFPAEEIARQIQAIRAQSGAGGEMFFHLRNLADNPALAAVIRREYSQPALVPPSPWLESASPAKPALLAVKGPGARFQWAVSGGDPVRLWVLQFRTDDLWTTEILPASETVRTFPYHSAPEIVAVRAVDRVDNLSPPAVLMKGSPASPGRRQTGSQKLPSPSN
ncbi:MAG: family 10 glycosylhydrolase [Verrucomicrobiota bacterium]|nr:family 10 glycosylhydrolase [Verrucomicrobiota bacterium]